MERRAQRKLTANFTTKDSTTPKLTAMSIGYIGGTEVSDELFEKRLMFGEGYGANIMPAP